MPYRVDTHKIAGLFGSKANFPAEKYQRHLESLDDLFMVEYGWTAMETLLEQYFSGSSAFFEFEGNSAKNWYTIELLAREYGEMLNNGDWYPGGNIDPFYSAKGFKMFAVDKENKINLPGPHDFPCLFTIHREDLKEAAGVAENISDEHQRMQFLDWIADAKKHDEDLMLFYF